MKKIINDKRQVLDRYNSLTRAQMIEMMDMALAGLPVDQHETATFAIDEYGFPYDDSTYYALFVEFKRPETDEEEQKREAQEAQYAEQKLKRDRAEFERLSKMFM